MIVFADVFTYLENTSLAAAIRQSQWLYPGLEILHIIGIVLVAGAAILFDLHLLGFSRKLSTALLEPYLLRWAKNGLWLVIPSGLLLFITNATTLGHQPVFWLKMILLVSAGLNGLLFHRTIFRTVANWDAQHAVPMRVKAAAVCSMVLWVAVIACGRLLAYV